VDAVEVLERDRRRARGRPTVGGVAASRETGGGQCGQRPGEERGEPRDPARPPADRMPAMISRHPWGGLADPALPLPCDVAILGIPYEGGAAWRRGAAKAPGALRALSASSPAVSEEGSLVEPAALRVRDLGDQQPLAEGTPDAVRDDLFSRVERAAAETYRLAAHAGRDTFLLSIGGDHSVTIPLVRGFAAGFPEGYGLVSLDAHPDLFDRYDGSPLSAGCPMRRALEASRLKPQHLLILGTRSYNREELDFMREKEIRFVPAREIERGGVEAAVALAGERLRGVGNVYLTLDIDVADPSCAPGTGAPVAGGLTSRQLLDLVRGLIQALPVRGMDLVEIAPPLDPADITLFLALQIVFEAFAVLAEKRRHRR
jgi:agmatinase